MFNENLSYLVSVIYSLKNLYSIILIMKATVQSIKMIVR